ncbi:MAG: hypothetical protein JWN33_681 [Candidatus Saccharibacteria bacterium]|nr:hypothetical protein [Candidatus Saccharibacteria bacterium]
MVVTTTPSIRSLVAKLQTSYPHVQFVAGNSFCWSSDGSQVTYLADHDDAALLLLHELAHGLLEHAQYDRDIHLLQMERMAWDEARTLATLFDVAYDEEIRESALDSYRQWLHDRSSCPDCTTNGLQTEKTTYTCLACRQTWRVNEARVCGLRRWRL